jgi:hypothetical protein
MCFILRFGPPHALYLLDNRKGKTMTSSTHDERWKELCEAIVEEPDSKRLMELVEKLNRVLDEREKELKRKIKASGYQ